MLRKNDAKPYQRVSLSFRNRGAKTKTAAGSIEKADKPR
jgi:hypothetical protein